VLCFALGMPNTDRLIGCGLDLGRGLWVGRTDQVFLFGSDGGVLYVRHYPPSSSNVLQCSDNWFERNYASGSGAVAWIGASNSSADAWQFERNVYVDNVCEGAGGAVM
jgi:hypothetical protein